MGTGGCGGPREAAAQGTKMTRKTEVTLGPRHRKVTPLRQRGGLNATIEAALAVSGRAVTRALHMTIFVECGIAPITPGTRNARRAGTEVSAQTARAASALIV